MIYLIKRLRYKEYSSSAILNPRVVHCQLQTSRPAVIDCLVNRNLEGRECVVEGISTLIVANALPLIALPEGTLRELAELLNLAVILAGINSSIKAGRLDTLLNPLDHSGDIVFRERTVGLKGVAGTMGSARNKVQLVPILERGNGFRGAQAGVHDALYGLRKQ